MEPRSPALQADSLPAELQGKPKGRSGPINSWQIGDETMETVRNFIFLGFKITADGDCSHEIERCLLLGRKALTNLAVKKKRHYFADKGPSSQSYGFSSNHVWM